MQETATSSKHKIEVSENIVSNKSNVLKGTGDIVKNKADILEMLRDFIKINKVEDSELNDFRNNLSPAQKKYLEYSGINTDNQLKGYLLWEKNGFFKPEHADFRQDVVTRLIKSTEKYGVGADFLGSHHIIEYINFHNELEKNK